MFTIILIIFVLGVWIILSAIFDWDRFRVAFETAEIEHIIGDRMTRWFVGIVGFVLVAGGIYRLS